MLAMEFGVVFSEVIPGRPHVHHWLRADDVSFSLVHGRVIASWEATIYAKNPTSSVIIRICSPKHDIKGEGHRFEH